MKRLYRRNGDRRGGRRVAAGAMVVVLLLLCRDAAAMVAFDAAGNYGPSAWTNDSNGGMGFGAWRFSAATQDWPTAFSLGTSSNAGGWNIDSGYGRCFGLLLSTQALTFRTAAVVRTFALQTNEAIYCKAVMNNDGAQAQRMIAIAAGSQEAFSAANIVCGISLNVGIAGVPDGFDIVYRSGAGLVTNHIGSPGQLGPNVFFWCLRTGPTNYLYDLAVGTNGFAGAFSSTVAPSNFWFRNSSTNAQSASRVLHFNYAGIDAYDPEFRILDAQRIGNSRIVVTYTADPSHYYVLLRGAAVSNVAAALSVRVPDATPDSFTNIMPALNTFFAVSQQQRSLPGDIDGDGIDDVYEVLRNLDPIDPADAQQLAADGSGLTNYQEYRMLLGYDISSDMAVSREFSIFNYGGVGGAHDAISRELSVFNIGGAGAAVEAISREASLFIIGGAGASGEAISREASVYIIGGGGGTEAISREVSAFNIGGAGGGTEGISREISIFNQGGAGAVVEAIGREVSLFNLGGGSAAAEAVSREASLFNLGGGSVATEAICREISIFNQGGAGGVNEAVTREVSLFNQGGAGSVHEAVSREVAVFGQGGVGVSIEAISREVSVFNTQ